MAFSFEPFLAISASHFMAVSAGPEHLPGKRKGSGCKCRNVKEEELLKYGNAKRIEIKRDGIEFE